MKNAFLRDLTKHKVTYLLALPGILAVLVFNYLPMVGIVIAFQDFIPFKGILGSEFVGLENIRFFLATGEWKQVTINTIFLNVLFIGTSTVFAIMLAIMITEISGKLFIRVTQSLMILPNFLSWAIVAVMSSAFLSSDTGIFNSILSKLGFDTINFYAESGYWPLILTIFKVWKASGFVAIIYIAAITGIDPSIYESATLDGASKFQCIKNITLPSITGTIVILALLDVGKIFYGDFGMIYTLVGDNPVLLDKTDVIDTFVYRALRTSGRMGYAAAVGLFQSVLGFVIVIAANWGAKKINPDYGLF